MENRRGLLGGSRGFPFANQRLPALHRNYYSGQPRPQFYHPTRPFLPPIRNQQMFHQLAHRHRQLINYSTSWPAQTPLQPRTIMRPGVHPPPPPPPPLPMIAPIMRPPPPPPPPPQLKSLLSLAISERATRTISANYYVSSPAGNSRKRPRYDENHPEDVPFSIRTPEGDKNYHFETDPTLKQRTYEWEWANRREMIPGLFAVADITIPAHCPHHALFKCRPGARAPFWALVNSVRHHRKHLNFQVFRKLLHAHRKDDVEPTDCSFSDIIAYALFHDFYTNAPTFISTLRYLFSSNKRDFSGYIPADFFNLVLTGQEDYVRAILAAVGSEISTHASVRGSSTHIIKNKFKTDEALKDSPYEAPIRKMAEMVTVLEKFFRQDLDSSFQAIKALTELRKRSPGLKVDWSALSEELSLLDCYKELGKPSELVNGKQVTILSDPASQEQEEIGHKSLQKRNDDDLRAQLTAVTSEKEELQCKLTRELQKTEEQAKQIRELQKKISILLFENDEAGLYKINHPINAPSEAN